MLRTGAFGQARRENAAGRKRQPKGAETVSELRMQDSGECEVLFLFSNDIGHPWILCRHHESISSDRAMIRPVLEHPWNVTPKEAVALQRALVERVVEKPITRRVRTIAGVDVSVRAGRVRTGIVVLDAHSLEVVERAVWEDDVTFPYVPGLLSFREIPAILPALEKLRTAPDLYMLDGQGRAHPRRFGLACHLGVLLDRSAIGVAKTRLTGDHETPNRERGSIAPLTKGDERIGLVVRTRTGVKPVFVSVGHRVDLDDALRWTLATALRFRLPEPTRLAHHLSKSGSL
jgi:deoxyribonuclease V